MAIKKYPLKGIVRTGADLDMEEGGLVGAVNLASNGDGALSMLEKPQTVLRLRPNEQCVYIHETTDGKRYVTLLGGTLMWRESGSTDIHTIGTIGGTLGGITALGNTLITDDSEDGIMYWLWRVSEAGYDKLGSRPPQIDINFGLDLKFTAYPAKAPDEGKDSDDDGIADPLEVMSKYEFPSNSYEFGWDDDYDSAWVPPKPVAEIARPDEVKDGCCDYSFKSKKTDQALLFTDTMNNRLLAHVNTFIAEHATNKNRFIFPFFVRYAYELYDGKIIMHSYPTLLVPNDHAPVFVLDGEKGLNLNKNYNLDDIKGRRNVAVSLRGRLYAYIARLQMEVTHDANFVNEMRKWRDIVKSVKVYITAPIYTYDQSGDFVGWKSVEDHTYFADHYGIGHTDGGGYMRHNFLDDFNLLNADHKYCKKKQWYVVNPINATIVTNNLEPPYYIGVLPEKDKADVHNLLRDTAQFYEVFKIDYDDLLELPASVKYDLSADEIEQPQAKLRMEKGTLKTLAARPLMPNDWHSRDKISAGARYVYNSRLNIADTSRTPHEPLSPYVQWQRYDTGRGKRWSMSVHIKDGGRNIIAHSDLQGSYDGAFPMYVFYPDAGAYKAELFDGTDTYTIALEPHPLLEGAYWRGDLFAGPVVPGSGLSGDHTAAAEGMIIHRNEVMTSDADNPFRFSAENTNTAGTGVVRALCANTEALGASQFGQHPMYVFTDKAVWAMAVDQLNGGFMAVQPVCRDVITAGTLPIGTDDEVIFGTSRGLIGIHGSVTRVLTDVLAGRPSGDYNKLTDLLGYYGLDTAKTLLMMQPEDEFFWRSGSLRIAYDYRHSRIYADCGEGYSWVYNMKSRAWTQSQTTIDAALNCYPEAEFVMGGNVVSLDTATRYQQAALLTRGWRTGEGLWLGKARQMVAIGNFVPRSGEVAVALFGTRDLQHWALVGSSRHDRLTRHGGSGYKLESGLLLIHANRPQEFALSSVDVETDVGQTNKMR